MTESTSPRVRRVERELLETLSQFLQTRLAEPLPAFASISAVDVTPDLRKARVFFRLVGAEKDLAETERILSRERPQFQKHIAHAVRLKFCPVLRFEYGRAPHQDDVDLLIEQLHRPRFGFAGDED